MMKRLDAITFGRSSVDLYGAQVGGRLEDMASFKKYIGGSPTNIAAGLARLGMRSAVITRVGDEHMGRFIREQLVREGVDVRGVRTDPDRLTALVLLGIRDDRQFPLIFYREDCADMALCEEDIDPDFIAEARSFTVTGTHLSHPRPEAAAVKALRIARETGARTALDIDYRPNLWGVAGHGEGESRYVESAGVTAKLRRTCPSSTSSSERRRSSTSQAARRTPSRPSARCGGSPMRSSSANAGRWDRWSSRVRSPTASRMEWKGPAFPSRCSTCSGRGTATWRASSRAGSTARSGRRPSSTRTPAGRSRSRATAAPLPIRAGRSFSSSSSAGCGRRLSATTRRSSTSTGPPTGGATGPRCGSSPSTTARRWWRWRRRRERTRSGSTGSRTSASRR